MPVSVADGYGGGVDVVLAGHVLDVFVDEAGPEVGLPPWWGLYNADAARHRHHLPGHEIVVVTAL
ncbi:hypothetical protein SMA90_31065, partial [Escherichia coli]